MSDDVILLEVADGVATVTLNRPQAMNALNRAMRARLAEVMRAVDADDAVRAVILTGAGERLHLSARYLENQRVAGTGPAFCSFGRAIRYRAEDVDLWAASKRRHSTSEHLVAA